MRRAARRSIGRWSDGRWLAAAAAGAASALPLVSYLRDFTVDDALISARYAAHLAAGLGYRFNAGGPVTDGVTPLGYPYLVAPFAGAGPLAALAAAKVIGCVAWLLGAAAVGATIDGLGGRRWRWAALLLVAVSPQLAAWSVAGMETGLALGLGAAAVAARAGRRDFLMAGLAGCVAWLRPEAMPWAFALAVAPPRPSLAADGHADPRRRTSRERRLLLVLVAVAPWVAAGLVRLVVFGRATPLSLAAKPSDFTHGAAYGLGCFLVTGGVAVVAWFRLAPWVRGLCAAALVHYLATVVAGGDWMPLSRLVVPVLPTVVVAAAAVLASAWPPLSLARLAWAVAGPLYALAVRGPAASQVGQARRAVIAELSPLLRQARAVGALDIGWLGAATDADILDFAGVTDPSVAALPGGHTTKAVPEMLLDARRLDAIVLLLAPGAELATPWTESRFARGVERWIALAPGMADKYEMRTQSSVPALPYLVVWRRAR